MIYLFILHDKSLLLSRECITTYDAPPVRCQGARWQPLAALTPPCHGLASQLRAVVRASCKSGNGLKRCNP